MCTAVESFRRLLGLDAALFAALCRLAAFVGRNGRLWSCVRFCSGVSRHRSIHQPPAVASGCVSYAAVDASHPTSVMLRGGKAMCGADEHSKLMSMKHVESCTVGSRPVDVS